ncbi:MAG: hypothetical protein K2W96_15270 [Gemmataceae bacterium]|nr:hypothetical protein [Gemmataceae bacterium]
MSDADLIGKRGESIAYSRLTLPREAGSPRPLFALHHLGDKFETLDFLVELLDAGRPGLCFFIQVRSTWKPLTKSRTPPRLRIEVSEDEVRRMAGWPAPTYLIGVHQGTDRVFIVSVHEGMTEAIPSITTAHELTSLTMKLLWDEVRDYWVARDFPRRTSAFQNGAST